MFGDMIAWAALPSLTAGEGYTCLKGGTTTPLPQDPLTTALPLKKIPRARKPGIDQAIIRAWDVRPSVMTADWWLKPRAHNRKLQTSSVADLVGLNGWRDERTRAQHGAEALALYTGIDVTGGDDISIAPKVGILEQGRQAIDCRLGKKSHTVHHRAANRFARLALIIKVLTEELKFSSASVYTTSEADRRALHKMAQAPVKAAMEKGVQVPHGDDDFRILHFKPTEMNFVRNGIVACYHIPTEDEKFWEKLSSEGSAALK
jgi:hypothetical protein